ncbi:MAG: MerR family transcriptional regulator [Acidobacteria bacterium]|nr:MerR family transcriptional regulator [Acidobacteriota bacterium]
METESRIPQKLFFRIGEVCDLIKVQPHVLRYWETEFPMLAPQKNRAGQRVYRRKDVEMVLRIRDLLYEEKFTIAGARKRLAEENRKGAIPRLRPAAKEKAVELDPDPEMDLQAPDEYFEADDDFESPVLEASSAPTATGKNSTLKPKTLPPSTMDEKKLATAIATPVEQGMSPRAQLALRVIKHDLEDLLTLLKADASIKRST